MTRSYPDEVDVVIVGSGPAGSTYARILSELTPDARVAIFEVGPTISDPPGAHVRNLADPVVRRRAQRASEGPGPTGVPPVANPGAVKAGERRPRPGTFLLDSGFQVEGEDGLPVAAMSSNVGGMAAHWTGACPRPGYSERIPFLDDLDDLLAEAERLLGVTQHAFAQAPFAKLVLDRLAHTLDPLREPEARVQPMPLAVHRRPDGRLVWSGSDVVMGDIVRKNPNVTLWDCTLVSRVLLRQGVAAGVEVIDRTNGCTTTIRARTVVVAADSLRTPQLLWKSGIRPDALGRYLNDQSQVVFAARIRDGGGVVASQTSPAGVDEYSGVTWIPYTDDQPFHGQVMQLDASPVPLAQDDPVVPGSIVGLGLFCAKDLQPSDRVEFSPDREDGYGMPAMTIHYRLTDADLRTLESAKTHISKWGRVVGEPLDENPFLLPFGSSLHYQGTVRMGTQDDGTSVCNPEGEVWEAPGVFVAGNGVIPTATACNPTLTSVALAVRGARVVAARLRPLA